MFDAKSLLEMMVRGAGQNAPQNSPQSQSGSGGLEEILGQLLGGSRAQGEASRGGGNPSGVSGLEDLMRQFGVGGSSATSRAAAPTPNAPPSPGQGGGNPLEDLLRNLTGSQSGGQGAGGLLDVLGKILGQATAGVKEGAQRVDDATGASGQLRDILTRTTGKSPEELMNTAKELVEKNKMGAGAAAGGLGAVVLGTQTGRALAGSALKIGALALIGGLAYKAVQNYQAGKPLLGEGADQQALVAAPTGSGFEARAITNDAALLYIRAMIAAAAADGRIDQTEMDKIIGGLKQMGLDREAEEFLANELNNPASTQDLASGVHGDAEAVQVFTAARIAIDLDTAEEHDFLIRLADDLGLDRNLAAHVDATARQAA
jgi:uncharacterized membrane protein YebE (DUF533 family)